MARWEEKAKRKRRSGYKSQKMCSPCTFYRVMMITHWGGALNSIHFVSHRFYWSEVPHARLSWGLCSGSRRAEGECWLGCVPCWSSGSPCKLIQLVTEFTSLPCGLRPQDTALGRYLQVPAPGPSYSTDSSLIQSQPETFCLVGATKESYSS